MAPSIPHTNVSPVTPVPSIKFPEATFMTSDLVPPQMSPLSDVADDKPMFHTNPDIDCWFSIPDQPIHPINDPAKTTTCDILSATDIDPSDKYVKTAIDVPLGIDVDSPSRAQAIASISRPDHHANSSGMSIELLSPAPPMPCLMSETHEVFSSLSFLNDPASPVQSAVPSVEFFGSVGDILDVNNQSMAFQDEECYLPVDHVAEPSGESPRPLSRPVGRPEYKQADGGNYYEDQEAIANAVEGRSAPTQHQNHRHPCPDLVQQMHAVPKSRHGMITSSQLCHNILQNTIIAPAVSSVLQTPLLSNVQQYATHDQATLTHKLVTPAGYHHPRTHLADIHPASSSSSISLVLSLTQEAALARRIEIARANGDMDMLAWLKAKEDQLRRSKALSDRSTPNSSPALPSGPVVPSSASPATSSQDEGKRRRRRSREFKYEISASSTGVAKSVRSKGASSSKKRARSAPLDRPSDNRDVNTNNAESIETPDAKLANKDRCVRCNMSAKATPMMRKGPDGAKSLCNACGLKWKRHGIY